MSTNPQKHALPYSWMARGLSAQERVTRLRDAATADNDESLARWEKEIVELIEAHAESVLQSNTIYRNLHSAHAVKLLREHIVLVQDSLWRLYRGGKGEGETIRELGEHNSLFVETLRHIEASFLA